MQLIYIKFYGRIDLWLGKSHKKRPIFFVERLAKNKCANNRTKAQIISSNKQWLLRYVL